MVFGIRSMWNVAGLIFKSNIKTTGLHFFNVIGLMLLLLSLSNDKKYLGNCQQHSEKIDTNTKKLVVLYTRYFKLVYGTLTILLGCHSQISSLISFNLILFPLHLYKCSD